MTAVENITVSIIIPAHNACAFIEAAIKSALGQTHKKIEVIVVDDGSSDDTAEVVRRISVKDQRVKLLAHPRSLGPSAARNTAIAHATGEWIAPLDADDSFTSERLACLLQAATSRRLDAIADNLQLRNFGCEELVGTAFPEAWMQRAEPITLQYFVERDYPGKHPFPSFGLIKPMIRKGFLDAHSLTYEPSVFIGEDFLLYCRLLLADAQFGLINSAFYNYYRRQNSISFSRDSTLQLIEVNRKVSRDYASFLEKRSADIIEDQFGLKEMLAGRETALWYQLFSWSLPSGQWKTALKCARHIPLMYLANHIWMAVGRRVAFLRRSSG